MFSNPLTISSASIANDLTFYGTITGTGAASSVTLAGPGNVVFLGNASYSGATVVNAGSLTVGQTGSLPAATTLDINGTSTVTLSNSAQALAGLNGSAASTLALSYNANSNATTLTIGSGSYAGAITDPTNAGASLVKTTTGTLYLSGANSYYGTTTVTAGALLYGSSSSISTVAGVGSITVGASGAVGLLASGLPGLLPYISGGSASNGTLVVTPATSADAVNFAAAALPYLSLGALDRETYSGTLTPPGGTFYRLGGGGGTLTVASQLTNSGGSTGLVVNGPPTAGKVILTATNNNFTGTTTVTHGTLQVGDGLTTNGSLPAGNVTDNAALIFANPASMSYTGLIGGNGQLAKTGGGGLTLLAAESYSGPTTISAGSLQLGNGGGSGSLAAASTITDNGTLVFDNSGTLAQGTNFSTAAITGSGSLLVSTGSVSLNAYNTYTGGTVVNGGTLGLYAGGTAGAIVDALTINPGATVKLYANNALGYDAGTSVTQVTINAGVLDAGPNGDEGYLANYTLTGGSMTNIAGGGDFPIQGGYSITTVATNVSSLISAAVQLRSSTVSFNVARGTVASGVDLQISGVISGAGGFNKTGNGTLALITATNTYTGGTIISGGIVEIGTYDGGNENGAALGTGTVSLSNAQITFGGTAGGTAVPTTIANNFTVNGGVFYAQDGYQYLTGTVTIGSSGLTAYTQWGGKDLSIAQLAGSGPLAIDRRNRRH